MFDRLRLRSCPRLWPLAALVALLTATAVAAVSGLRAQDGGGPGGPPGAAPPPAPPVQTAVRLSGVQVLGQMQAPRRFQVTIAADAPLTELLPAAPAADRGRGRGPATSLAAVPEVSF